MSILSGDIESKATLDEVVDRAGGDVQSVLDRINGTTIDITIGGIKVGELKVNIPPRVAAAGAAVKS